MKRLISILLLAAFLSINFNYIDFVFADEVFVYPPYQLDIAKLNNKPYIERSTDGTIAVNISWKFDGALTDINYFELYAGDSISALNQRQIVYPNDPYLTYNQSSKTITYKMITLPPNNQKFKSGTVYYARVRSAKITELPNNQGTVINFSAFSNTITFLTPIFVEATTNSESSIDIVWDDVYYNNLRLDYDIYVSKDISFTTPTRFQIDGSKITQLQSQPLGGRVEILPNKKLKYTAVNLIPSSVYYVKVQPRNLPSEIIYRYPDNLDIAETTTYIQADAVRLNNEIVRLKWLGVSNASNSKYEIYKGSQNQIPQLIGIVSGNINEFFVSVGINDEVFFRVQVDVLDSLGNNITVRSRDLYVHPYVLPYNPPSVEEFNAFPIDTTKIKLTFKKPTDTDVYYDFYLKKLSEPDSSYQLILNNYQMKDSDILKDVYGKDTNYYQIDITNLELNTVYVFKVIAKKKFFDYDKNTDIYTESAPSIAISYTLSGEIGPPTVPESIYISSYTDTTVSLKWDPIFIPGTNIIDNSVFYNISVAKYTYGMDITNPSSILPEQSQTIRNPQIDFDGKIKYTFIDLNPNTRYVFYLRTYRIVNNQSVYSEPSNVAFATTLPSQGIVVPSKPPTVDDLTVLAVSYNYISVQWKYYDNVYYEIQINDNTQNVNSWKTIDASFVPAAKDINLYNNTCYYVVKDLKPATLYGIRIRSYIIKDNQKIYSEYSNPVYARTTNVPPPKEPLAFGIKEIGIDYCLFVWETSEDGRTYIIQIDNNPTFQSYKEYQSEVNATSLKVSNLKPNTRYYAKIYSVSEDNQRSQASYVISFTTKKDLSEYDYFGDNSTVDYTLPIITNEDATLKQMIIEVSYKYTNTATDFDDLIIDFTKRNDSSIRRFTFKVRLDVLKSVISLNKTVLIKLDDSTISFSPQAIDVDVLKKLSSQSNLSKVYVQLSFIKNPDYLIFPNKASNIYDVDFSVNDNIKKINVDYFNKAIDVTLNSLIKSKKTYPNLFNKTLAKWDRLLNYIQKDSSYNFKLSNPQAFVLEKSDYYNDIITSKYAMNIYELLDRYNNDDTNASLQPTKGVTRNELATYLVYFATYKRLGSFTKDNMLVSKAIKAGIIDSSSDNMLTKQEAVDILVRFYEIYTSNIITVKDNIGINLNNVEENYQESIKKASSKGWLFEKSVFPANEIATREYILGLLNRILKEVD
ncbi:fibronectin type III domain-containing protein [Caldicellulosiruptoraceae bacterium PP1]